jgi:uncharacterized short protein YbdD (DUF466 family)
MKRAIISGLVSLLVLAAVTAAAGCGGGDAEQAQKYMEQGDKLAAGIGNKSEETDSTWKALQENTDPALRGAAWEQFQSVNSVERVLLQRAKAEYQKINGLKGVNDYVKYVELKSLALDAQEQMMKATDDFFEKAYNNRFGSQQELEAALRKFQAEVKDLQEEKDRAAEEAEQFKKEKNL